MRFLSKAAIAAIAVVCLAGSAGAAPIIYQASLSGPAEAPPNDSPGTGSTRVTIDTEAHTLDVSFIFADLVGTTTAAHIHGPTAEPFLETAGVMTATPTFPGTPLGVTNGTFEGFFDLTLASSFNPAFVTANGGTPAGAEAALAAALAAGKAYLNIHSSSFPGGEIRGFLTPIPLPAGLFLLLGGFIVLAWAGRRSRS
jgi:hypothetical protein